MPDPRWWLIDVGRLSGSFFITLLFCVLAVVAYRRFRLPSLAWLMIVGFWNLLQEPALALLTNYVAYCAWYNNPSRVGAAMRAAGDLIDAMSGGPLKRLSLLATGAAHLIGVILPFAFLLVLMRDLRRLFKRQPQASESEA